MSKDSCKENLVKGNGRKMSKRLVFELAKNYKNVSEKPEHDFMIDGIKFYTVMQSASHMYCLGFSGGRNPKFYYWISSNPEDISYREISDLPYRCLNENLVRRSNQ